MKTIITPTDDAILPTLITIIAIVLVVLSITVTFVTSRTLITAWGQLKLSSVQERYPHQMLVLHHYSDVIIVAMASQITGLTIVYSAGYSGANQRKHQISTSLAFVRGIHRSLVNSPHRWSVTRKMFLFDDVVMEKTNPPIAEKLRDCRPSDFPWTVNYCNAILIAWYTQCT